VPFETAYYSLVDLAGSGAGETVLIQGAAGSVGAAAVQIARSLRLRVIATCGLEDRDNVLANGAESALDYAQPDLTQVVLAVTGGRGVDIVIEVAARTNLMRDLALAATGGRIVIVGGPGEAPFDTLPVIAKGLRISGVDLRSIAPQRAAQIHAALGNGLSNGTLRPRATHRFSLDQIADAHAAIESGSMPGGVVLEIDGHT
jgi:NADPH2:quinone reductase